jgi:hypothetical protein
MPTTTDPLRPEVAHLTEPATPAGQAPPTGDSTPSPTPTNEHHQSRVPDHHLRRRRQHPSPTPPTNHHKNHLANITSARCGSTPTTPTRRRATKRTASDHPLPTARDTPANPATHPQHSPFEEPAASRPHLAPLQEPHSQPPPLPPPGRRTRPSGLVGIGPSRQAADPVAGDRYPGDRYRGLEPSARRVRGSPGQHRHRLSTSHRPGDAVAEWHQRATQPAAASAHHPPERESG